MNNKPFDRRARALQEAYAEFLYNELKLLNIELGDDLGPGIYAPCGTFAKPFHFPSDGNWRDVPPPSSRAEAVLRSVGILAEVAA